MEFVRCLVYILFFSSCRFNAAATDRWSPQEEEASFWNDLAQKDLNDAINMKQNLNVAKNVILFLGDGMGVTTVTAGRILKGQMKGQPGEEEHLIFDTFPHSSLVKTYNVNLQTPDSAGTGTAYLCGVKTNGGLIGVTAKARNGNCTSLQGNELDSILKWSQAAGKSVGIVTTARVTHATPAATYAHTVDRNWEGDAEMKDVSGCKDIALQLITENSDIQVIMGGGRRYFTPVNGSDPETEKDDDNNRLDGRNLIKEWASDKASRGHSHTILNKTKDLREVDPNNVDYVLGLFSKSHMMFEVDRDTTENGEPSLAEMTELAIKILRKNENGFFMLVEGGRIDHGHHASQATRALNEVLALERAVEAGVNITSPDDTLIVVTADHSHVFTIGGYPSRGNNILASKDYIQQSAVPLPLETHGGEDVVVYAQGPMAHLFHGVREQNYIAHVMAYASCVGTNQNHCAPKSPKTFPKPVCAGNNLSAMLSMAIPVSMIFLKQFIDVF